MAEREEMTMEDELIDEQIAADEELGTGEDEVADVEETIAEEPETVEAVESAVILKVDDVPELTELVAGDQVTMVIDSVNEDGTIGLSVMSTAPAEGASEMALEGGEELGGREEVAAALQG